MTGDFKILLEVLFVSLVSDQLYEGSLLLLYTCTLSSVNSRDMATVKEVIFLVTLSALVTLTSSASLNGTVADVDVDANMVSGTAPPLCK